MKIQKNRFSILILFLLLLNISNAQEIKTSKTDSTFSKESFLSLNCDFFSLSLKYERKIFNKVYAGIGIMGGIGYRKILGNRIELKYYSHSEVFETKKVKLYVSNDLSNFVQHSIGIYCSTIVHEIGSPYLSSGMEYELFYGLKKIKIGHRIQLGSVFIKYINSDVTQRIKYKSITPIILQIRM